MGQLLRIEDPKRVSHIFSRTRNGRLWFINNKQLELKLLAYLARLQAKYGFVLYALALMGNHFHELSRFPGANRAPCMRDFKGYYSRCAKGFYPELADEQLWKRRYNEQAVLLPADIEKLFWYVVLQAIRAGLCDSLKHSPIYSCFHAAICGIDQEFRYFRASEYRAALRSNPRARKKDFIDKHKLKFSRLPGYEHLSQQQYKEMMLKKYAEKRLEAIQLRAEEKGITQCFSKEALRAMKPGALPKNPILTSRWNPRPIAVSDCPEAKKSHLSDYFDTWNAHRAASLRYRNGDSSAVFPPGTYKPPLLVPPP